MQTLFLSFAIARSNRRRFNPHAMHRPSMLIGLAALAFLFSFVTSSQSASTPAVFRPEKLAEMDAAINEAIAARKCPGGVLWFEHRGFSYHKAYGNRAVVP